MASRSICMLLKYKLSRFYLLWWYCVITLEVIAQIITHIIQKHKHFLVCLSVFIHRHIFPNG